MCRAEQTAGNMGMGCEDNEPGKQLKGGGRRQKTCKSWVTSF